MAELPLLDLGLAIIARNSGVDTMVLSLALACGAVFLGTLGVAQVLETGRARRWRAARLEREYTAEPRTTHSPRAVSRFASVRVPLLSAAAFVSALGLGVWAFDLRPLSAGGLYLALVSAALVLAVTAGVRRRRQARRRAALRNGFPDALDLMVICVEAGLGLDAAMNRVTAEIEPVHPALGAALRQVGREVRAGRPRGEALQAFAKRIGLPEVESFATLLNQSELLGTGAARALRVQAEEMRAARMLHAEEQAQALPVKLTLPLVLCVLPAMIAVVLLPGIIAVLRDVLPNLGH
jgi:tight adherence protein C